MGKNSKEKFPIKTVFDKMGCAEELYEFFRDIGKNGYKYVIIVPRKCLTELKGFMRIFPDIIDKSKTIFLTPNGFIIYKEKIIEELKNGTLAKGEILIVDDIMIYGRGINRFLSRLVNNFPKELRKSLIESIELKVFAESNKNFIFSEEFSTVFEDNYSSSICLYNLSEIKRLSDLFLESFYAMNIPNTSFIRSYFGKDEYNKKDEITENIHSGFIFMPQNSDQQKYNYYSVMYAPEQDIFGDFAEFSCMRIYFNDDSIAYTPYVFLCPLLPEEIDQILRIIESWLLEGECDSNEDASDFLQKYQICSLINDHKNPSGSENIDVYILKEEFITTILSDLLGVVYKKMYPSFLNVIDTLKDDSDILEMSYGTANVRWLNKLLEKFNESSIVSLKQLIDKLSKIQYSILNTDKEMCFKEEEDYRKMIFENVLSVEPVDSCQTYLKKCFSINHIKDETKASEKKERIRGITTRTFWNLYNSQIQKEDKREFFFYLLYCMDTGVSALSINSRTAENGLTYYCAIEHSGEQAYRIQDDSNQIILKYFSEMESYCINRGLSKDELNDRINAFIDGLVKSDFCKCTKNHLLQLNKNIIEQCHMYREHYVYRGGNEEHPGYKDLYKKVMEEKARGE